MNSTLIALFLGLAVVQVSCVFDSPKGFPAPQGHPLSKNKTSDPLQLDNEDEDEDEEKNLRQTLAPSSYPNLINSIGAVFGARPEVLNKSVENFASQYNYKKNPTTVSEAVESTTLPATTDEDEDEDGDGDEQDAALKPQGHSLSKIQPIDPLQLDSEDEDEDEVNKTTKPTVRPALYPNLIKIIGTAFGASQEALNQSVENFFVGYNYGKNPTTEESLAARFTLSATGEEEDEEEDGDEQDVDVKLPV